MIRIKNLRTDRMQTIEIPVAADGGAQIKRGVINRARLMGDRGDASSAKPTLVVTKFKVPNTVTLLPRGKKGDTSDPLQDSVRNAPDVLRKLKNRDIEIIEERGASHGGR